MASAQGPRGGHGWLSFVKHVIEELSEPIALDEVGSKGWVRGARQGVEVALGFVYPLGPERLGFAVEVAKEGLEVFHAASVKMRLQAPIDPRGGASSVGPLVGVDSGIGDGDADVVANAQLVDEAMQVLAGVWSG